jgi:hypothetical protein
MLWVRLSGDTGLLMLLLRQNVEWAFFLGLPLLIAVAIQRTPISTPDKAALVGLVTGMCAVVIAGAKPGAGPYHLIPFIPSIAYLTARIALRPGADAAAAVPTTATGAFVLTLAFVAAVNQAHFVRTIRDRGRIADTQDVARFVDSHPGVVAMAYGTTEALSFARPLLVFRTDSYFIDQPAVREYQLAGLELPAASARALEECRVRYWLVPKGEGPFAGRNAYDAVLGRPLYSEEFLASFRRTYLQTASTDYFDVWQCHSSTADAR